MKSRDWMAEVWLPVVGHEGHYEVSNMGRVRSVDRLVPHWRGGWRSARGCVLSAKKVNNAGYATVQLPGNEYWLVHRLVLTAFIGPCPEGMEGCHNNGVAIDNRLENLRWDTKSANHFDLVKHGNHPQARKTHCKRGHEFTRQNTRISPSNGGRTCRTCERLREIGRGRRRKVSES